jgi:drug/metabolite transporter (DMT)-like permease
MILQMWLFITLTILLWGTAPLFEQLYTRDISVVTIYTMFFVIGMLLMPVVAAIYYDTIKAEFPMLLTTRRDVLVYGVAGLLISIMAFVCYLRAIQTSNNRTHLVVALTCIYPLITAFLLWYLFRTKVSWVEWIGVVFIVIGTALLVAKNI